ncbi:ribonuclease H protein [Trifolium medium]|uniref:Ribonuclease H protein n=1 Tax=Trifolium medium TaxID=97028 RepID=A0A392PH86_9FABA|nr:ribonuclease H protein [Trifolium medium]
MEVETIIHALRDCPIASSFWIHVVLQRMHNIFFSTNLLQWIELNISCKEEISEGVDWNGYWAMACHFLWSWKNKEDHDSNVMRPPAAWNQVRKLAIDFMEARNKNIVMHNTSRRQIQVRWNPPMVGWVKLNTDGASRGGIITGCGGVIRGSEGQWLGCFCKKIGRCNVITAELWGVLEGLKLANLRGFKKIELVLDSKAALQRFMKKGDIKGS